MSLKTRIKEDIKLALKEKKELKLEALRMLSSSIQNKEIEKKQDALNDMELLSLLKRQIKVYEETAAQSVQAHRKESAEKEFSKVEILKEYLPPAISEEKLKSVIKACIATTQATSLKDQGLVIKTVQDQVKGGADNVLIAKLVREQLQSL